jgi:hypothetical protein
MLAGRETHPRNTLLQQISHKSDLLISQLADFKNLIRDRRVVSFYETEQTRQLEFVRRPSINENTEKIIDSYERTARVDAGKGPATFSRRSIATPLFSNSLTI